MSVFLRAGVRRWLMPAAAIVVVAVLAAWWWQARPTSDKDASVAFRDEVIDVIGARFGRTAVPVAGDADAIRIGDVRRDIGQLHAAAGQLPEKERRQKIYVWFLGDPETATRVVVREQPFEVTAQPQPSPTKPHLDGIAAKPVKTLAVRPDGSLMAPGQPR